MFRVQCRRYNGVIIFDDFDSVHEAEIVFDFVIGIFDTDYAVLKQTDGGRGWETLDEYGEE
jgi:hypothetical protein